MAVPGFRRLLATSYLFAGVCAGSVLASACSGGGPIEIDKPTSDEVRTFYGLNPGSCTTYEIPARNISGRIEVTGPNEISIAGETVFDQRLILQSAERPFSRQFKTDAEGEVRLLRSSTGAGREEITSRYEDVTAPIFLGLAYDRAGEVILEPGAKFDIETTPELCGQMINNGESCQQGMLERHVWQVFEALKTVPTPDGEMEAVELLYRRTIGAETDEARYQLVPGRGIVGFTDFSGDRYNICAWKTCGTDGTCDTDVACSDMLCPF